MIGIVPIFLCLPILIFFAATGVSLESIIQPLRIIPLAIGVAIFLMLYSSIQALVDLFRKGRIVSEEAILIDLKEEPELEKILISLSQSRHLRAKLPNAVILHFYPELFVTRDYRNLYQGRVRGRILAIGLPLLSTLSVDELRAVLAHELAHFSGKEVIYLAFINRFLKGLKNANMITAKFSELHNKYDQVNSLKDAICRFVTLLFVGGFINFYNALVLCMRIPNFILHRYISLWENTILDFSRSAEIRADCIAANVCGRQNFTSGLTKAVGCQAAFSLYVERYFKPILSLRKYPNNLFQEFRRLNLLKSEYVSDYMESKLLEKSEKYDIHPSLSERIEIVSNVFEENNLSSEDIPAYSVIVHLEKYEKAVTLEHIKHRLQIDDFFDFSSVKPPFNQNQKITSNWKDYLPPFSLLERRFWSLIFDLFLILFLFIIVGIIQLIILTFVIQHLPESSSATTHILSALVALLIELFVATWLYFAFFESSKWQGTPGKKFFELYIENKHNQHISFFSATIRFILKVFFPFLFPVNFLLVIFGNRCLHNMLSGSWVESNWDN